MSDETVSSSPATNTAISRGAVVQGVLRLCKGFGSALARRRTRMSLGELDDYLLKDIGLSRSDIDRIAFTNSIIKRKGNRE